jgi:peptide/nickel transport system substrate-binding protein
MMTSRTCQWPKVVLPLIVVGLLISGCGPTPEPVQEVVTQIVKETVIVQGTPEVVEKEITKVVESVVTTTPEPTEAPELPTVGGKLVLANTADIESFDPHYQVSSYSMRVFHFIGATLVIMSPEGEIVPYLAESWEISEDGLTWDFYLRDDVEFHDGSPLTAQDYAWSLNRVFDADSDALVGSSMRGNIAAEAMDDHHLRLNLQEFDANLLENLCLTNYSPLSQAWMEAAGDEADMKPMSVGPYKFGEYVTGEKVVLERNPDFNWGPAFVENQGPYYIETIEFRIIPEMATILAGLEAGEIDHAAIQSKDVPRIKETGMFQIFEGFFEGMYPGLHMNVSRPPFDDLRVRQALAMVVDREGLIKLAVGEGNGVQQYGPLSQGIPGYWPGVEYVSYKYNLEKARQLMQEAGYTYNDQGMLERDGEPLKLVMKSSPGVARDSEVLQEQFRALGIDVEIQQEDEAVMFGELMAGDYDFTASGYVTSNTGLLKPWFSSQGLNVSHIDDPELEELLALTRSVVDPEDRQAALEETQRRLVEQAYIIPLYTSKTFVALNSRVKGAILKSNWPETLFEMNMALNDAYISPE